MVNTNFLQNERRFDQSTKEWMDQPETPLAELTQDLRNLRLLNRWFGTFWMVDWFLRQWLKPGDKVSILDLCTGSGDIPRFIVRWARRRGVIVNIDAVDAQPETLRIAEQQSFRYPEIRFHSADALRFDAEADFCLCFLALHHFNDDEAIHLLGRMQRMSRRFALVADLERSDLGILGIYLLTETLFRLPMTRHDARLSFHRAFSWRELRQLTGKAGWNEHACRRFLFHRQAFWTPGTLGSA